MATTTTTKSPTVAPNVAQSIQSQISAIQSGINSLKPGGTTTAAQTGTNPADAYTPKPSNNLKDYRDASGNQVTYPVDPATGQQMINGKLDPSTAPNQQLDPNAQAPQGLVDSVGKAQGMVNNLSNGMSLKQNANGSTSSTPDLGTQYKQAHQAVAGTGIPAAQNAGAGSAVVGSTLNSMSPQTESPSIVGNLQAEDSTFDSIFTQFDEFMSPTKQRESLLSEYQKLSGSLGIDSMNQELIDTKRIIDGTEDDIRSEVTAAGGMATDSQVLAMSNARNKSLIKNYNYLLESRDSAQTQLSTMMQLSVQDRQFAEAEFDRKLNFAFKVQEFKQKATDNARSGLKWAIENGAGAGILSNPYETSLVEKTLGLPKGGLAGIVAKQQEKDYGFMNVDGKVYRTDPKTGAVTLVGGGGVGGVGTLGTPGSTTGLVNQTTGKADPRAQIANIIATTGAKTDDKLKLAGAVVSAAQKFAEGNKEGSIKGLGFGQIIPSLLLGQKGQDNRTDLAALTGTVESWMTGASVSEEQQKRIKNDMIPKNGDSDGQVRRKINALTNYMMNYTAGALATQGVNWAPEKIDFFAPVVAVDPMGDEWVAQ